MYFILKVNVHQPQKHTHTHTNKQAPIHILAKTSVSYEHATYIYSHLVVSVGVGYS